MGAAETGEVAEGLLDLGEVHGRGGDCFLKPKHTPRGKNEGGGGEGGLVN